MTDASAYIGHASCDAVTVMGGAFTIPGNETPHAETNIAFDPDAAAVFFSSFHTLNVHVVPLDMTRKVIWSKKTVAQIPATTPQAAWIKHMLLTWFAKYSHEREGDFNLHDPLAVYLTFFPEHATWIKSGIEVVTKGIKRGQTVLNPTNPVCQIAWELDNPEAIAEHIFSLLFF